MNYHNQNNVINKGRYIHKIRVCINNIMIDEVMQNMLLNLIIDVLSPLTSLQVVLSLLLVLTTI